MISAPIRRGYSCRYCAEENSGIIEPDRVGLAKRMSDGSLKCYECQVIEIRQQLVKAHGYDSPVTRGFIEDEDRKIREWNNNAKNVNEANKRLGGNKDILKSKRSSYLGK